MAYVPNAVINTYRRLENLPSKVWATTFWPNVIHDPLFLSIGDTVYVTLIQVAYLKPCMHDGVDVNHPSSPLRIV